MTSKTVKYCTIVAYLLILNDCCHKVSIKHFIINVHIFIFIFILIYTVQRQRLCFHILNNYVKFKTSFNNFWYTSIRPAIMTITFLTLCSMFDTTVSALPGRIHQISAGEVRLSNVRKYG